MNSDCEWFNQWEIEQQEQQYLDSEELLKADDEAYQKWNLQIVESGLQAMKTQQEIKA